MSIRFFTATLTAAVSGESSTRDRKSTACRGTTTTCSNNNMNTILNWSQHRELTKVSLISEFKASSSKQETLAHFAAGTVDLGLNDDALQRGAQDLRDRKHSHALQLSSGEEVVGMSRLTAARSSSSLSDVSLWDPDRVQTRDLRTHTLVT